MCCHAHTPSKNTTPASTRLPGPRRQSRDRTVGEGKATERPVQLERYDGRSKAVNVIDPSLRASQSCVWLSTSTRCTSYMPCP